MKSRLHYAVLCFVLAVLLLFIAVPLLSFRMYPKVSALKVTHDIEKGQQFTPKDMESIEIGALSLPGGVQLEAEDAIGRYAAVDLVKDDVLFLSKLSQLPLNGELPKDILPEGNGTLLVTLRMIEGSEYSVPEAGDIVKLNGFRNKLIDIPELQFVRILSVVRLGQESEVVLATVSLNTEQQEYIKKYRDDVFYASVIVRGNEELAEKLLTEQSAYFEEVD